MVVLGAAMEEGGLISLTDLSAGHPRQRGGLGAGYSEGGGISLPPLSAAKEKMCPFELAMLCN